MHAYLILHYIFCIFLIVYLYKSKKKYKEFFILLISALDGIPILMMGDSPSSAIFISDVILGLLIIKLLLNKNKINDSYINKKSNLLLMTLLYWIIFVTIIAFSRSITKKYDIFIIYGVFRWIIYILCMKVFFLNEYSYEESKSLIENLLKIFAIFGILLLLHQMGLINMTGIESMGSRIDALSNLYAEHDYKQTFMAINKVNLGSICYTSIWICIYYLYEISNSKKDKIIGLFLLILFFANLINTWSRSDMLGLLVSMIILFITGKKIIKRDMFLLIYIIIFIVLFIILLYINGFITLDLSTFDFFMQVFHLEKGTGSGGYRLLIFESTIKYLKDNPIILITGLGPNGFRIMHELTGFKANFGHNTYLHNTVEIGIIGASIILYIFINYIKIFYNKYVGIRKEHRIYYLWAFFIGKCITGLSVDIFFGIDSMLFSNIMLIGFFATIITTTSKC